MSRLDRQNGLSISEFVEKRNKILILMKDGGLGDVFSYRMIFEDIKKLIPNAYVVFACPEKYFSAIEDHPFIDEVTNCETIDKKEFIIHYDITSVCFEHEMKIAPFSDLNRSEIVSEHCGFVLTNHNMHINLEEIYVKEAKDKLPNKINFAICPFSKVPARSMTMNQIKKIKNKLDSLNINLICLHNKENKDLENIGIPVWSELNNKQWMGSLAAVDYVISVDTASFHFSGGIGKPLIGIFGPTDGKVIGKHYEFILIQRHRDEGDWECGPCYDWFSCPKTKNAIKPCMKEINDEKLINSIDVILEKYPIKYSNN